MHWDIGIDLGSERARVAEKSRGPIIDTASALAYRSGSDSPFAAGDVARRLIGRAYEGVSVRRPLSDGVLENNVQLERFLLWLERETGVRELPGKRFSIAMTAAPFARPVQMDAMLTSAIDTGAGEAALIRSDIASAAGAGLAVAAPEAKFVVDVGAGKVTSTLITLGRVASFGYIPYGMSRLDDSIVRHVRTKYAHAIGLPTAAEIKHALSSAEPDTAPRHIKMKAAGVNLATRLPDVFDVEADGIVDISDAFVREIVRLCVNTISDAPEELSADLNDAGAVLTGGGALLPGLDKRLSRELGIPVRIADAPALCTVRGLYRIMQDPDAYDAAVMSRLSRSTWRS